jgi:hypothetical protein
MAEPLFQYFRTAVLLFLLFCVAGSAGAQVDNIYVYGTVRDYTTSKKMDGITVTVLKNGEKLSEVVTSANGKYEFNLDYGNEYKLVYSKVGIVGRNVTIDTRNIPEENRAGGLAMNVEMTLFNELPGVDFSFLQQPSGKSKYDPTTGSLAWDIDYTAQMKSQMDKMFKEYDAKQKREASDEANFAKLMAAGNTAMSGADFKQAVESFTGALAIKPADPIAKAKLSDAQIKLNELEQARKKDEQYAALVKSGDDLFGKKNYADAKTKYAEAAALKDQEPYPKQKMKECDAFIADLAQKAAAEKKAQELDAKYKAAVDAGDAAFKAAKYDEAKARFSEAAGLKPAEKYPPEQLAAIARKMEEDKAALALDVKFKAAVTAADAAFQKADYDAAKGKYKEALGLKPKEKYPSDQLAAIDKKLAELAAKAEADKHEKELDAQYTGMITAADAAFQKADYDAAKGKYKEALGLKPKEKYPADQLAAIDKKLAELAAKAEADRKSKELDAQYQQLLEQGEGLFTAAKYADARTKFQAASAIRPDDAHPKERIVEIDAKLAELARLANEQRKQKEVDAKYTALIASADRKSGSKKLGDALNDYQAASDLKPDEQYPKDRIAAIGEQMDADTRAQAEKDRVEKERMEKQRQYDGAIARADGAFQQKDYNSAKEGYAEALEIKPDEKYPRDRLAAVDQALADMLQARQDSLQAALADQERLRKESAAADSARSAAELERQQREAAQALDDRYAKLVVDADGLMANGDLPGARDLYVQALDVKPKETYPQNKIVQIDQLIAERERQAKERELAEQQEQPTAPETSQVATTDNRKEQEAEEFMREAREREEAEKYERIKKLKASVAQRQEDNSGKAAERQEAYGQRNKAYTANAQSLYEGSQEMRKRNEEELAAFSEALAERRKEVVEQDQADRDQAVTATADKVSAIAERDAGWEERHTDQVQKAVDRQQQWKDRLSDRVQAGEQRTSSARQQLQRQADRNAEIKERGNSDLARERDRVAQLKQREETRQRLLTNISRERTMATAERLAHIPMDHQRASSDYGLNKLASQYPQGVTEESITQGNKVIIRRVVVDGNKADEYSKVIAKWGTFYFKNGQSISEQVWTVNTED